jgi:hypothetical protein
MLFVIVEETSNPAPLRLVVAGSPTRTSPHNI